MAKKAKGKKPKAGVLKTKGMSAKQKMARIKRGTARKGKKVR